jgi:glycosyltransferase involved in cell wall biosynthesis
MKVLLSSYSCLPDAGSEPGIGWNWAKEIAACGHEVVVITRAVNQQKIQRVIKRDSVQNPRFVFHDLSEPIQKLYSLPFGSYAYYVLWQYTAAKRAAREHATEKFDQVQHITWGSFRLPSFMGRLGVPFVFGPVAGGEDTPKKLRAGLGFRGRAWDGFRRLSNILLTCVPGVKGTYAQATEIVATTNETYREIPARYRDKTRVQQAVGIDSESLELLTHGGSTQASATQPRRLNLLFVGRLLPWKGLHIGLKALAALDARIGEVHLTIVGSGSDESRLKRLAKRLKISESVSWIPWMTRETLLKLYVEHDLLLFPSLHDSGGMAVLEAMSLGLPVLCLDLGGPGVSVDNTCGRVFDTEGCTEEDLVKSISDYLSQVLADRSVLKPLADGARRRASSLSWKAIVSRTYSLSLQEQVK